MSQRSVLISVLPGPDRKRSETLYHYQLVYRQPDTAGEGCVALWHVAGGRTAYQVALERDWRGGLSWHCTCADHVYRSEQNDRHVCKHIQGVQEFLPAQESRAA